MNAPRDSSAVGASDDARAGVGATAAGGRRGAADEACPVAGCVVTHDGAGNARHSLADVGRIVVGTRADFMRAMQDDAAARGGALREADGRTAVPRELAAVKREVVLDVFGTPAPKGSSRAVLIGGRPQVVPNSSTRNAREQRAWVKAVRDAWAKADKRNVRAFDGIELHAKGLAFVSVPLVVEIAFRLERPKSHWRKSGLAEWAPARPLGKPDVDKLARCTIDALTGYVFDDDSRVTMLLLAKDYADPGYEGARIVVRERV